MKYQSMYLQLNIVFYDLIFPSSDDHCGEQDIIIDEGSSFTLTSFYYDLDNTYGIQFGCKHVVSVPDGHQILVHVVDVSELVLPWDVLLLDREVSFGEDEYISDGNTLEIVYRLQTGARGLVLSLSDYVPPGRCTGAGNNDTSTI